MNNMKLLSVAVCRVDEDASGSVNECVILCQETDTSNLWFGKQTLKQLCTFTVRETALRTETLCGLSYQYKDNTCHAYKHQNGLVVCAITNDEYNKNAAYRLLKEIYNDFNSNIKPKEWLLASDFEVNFRRLSQLLQLYQNPPKDKMDEIQEELDKTQLLALDVVEKIIERGEKIDDLIESSKDLDKSAKLFARSAKKLNKCRCVIL